MARQDHKRNISIIQIWYRCGRPTTWQSITGVLRNLYSSTLHVFLFEVDDELMYYIGMERDVDRWLPKNLRTPKPRPINVHSILIPVQQWVAPYPYYFPGPAPDPRCNKSRSSFYAYEERESGILPLTGFPLQPIYSSCFEFKCRFQRFVQIHRSENDRTTKM